MEFIYKNNKNMLFVVFAGILFYVGLQNISGIIGFAQSGLNLLFPFVLGAAIAFILNVPMKQIEVKLFGKLKLKSNSIKRGISLFVTILIVVCIILVVMLVVVPELIRTCNSLIKQIPSAYADAKQYLESLNTQWPQFKGLIDQNNINLDTMTNTAVKFLQNVAIGFLDSTFGIVGGVLSSIITFFISFTFAIYVLFQKEKLSRQAKKIMYAILPVKVVDRVIYVGKLSNTTFSGFLSGQCLEAVILGTMFFVSMTIFRMPYAWMMGVLIALTALVPIFGSLVGLIVGFLLIVIISPVQAIGFVILFFVLQQIEGNLIYPHVVGGSVGLPSIWVLFAVTIGANLMGIAGMIIFIPLCSVCYTLIRESVDKRLIARKISEQKWTIHKDDTQIRK
ncbi:AI-2E family transporter [[Clostridium] fimetarium]|uniref:Predicted PurR-regulated permease PerM n=1 Tax=[Clostridium] fimetarium TaxID=99656 RepID=A0A1I0MEB2_9FIRM|nr:AI-2E family transporter [[Clostridium] fimetarium]SEV86747.1 Predicted PurR-regulated permease PerM [[Clostridium] fimetarium]